MKNKMVAYLLRILLSCLAVSTIACDQDSDQNSGLDSEQGTKISSNWTEIPNKTNKNLKYFGYFHADGFLGSGPFYSEITSLNNSNIVMINSAWTIEQSLDALAAVKAMSAQAFFSIHDFFDGGIVTVANSASLRSDYKKAWDARRNAIASYIEDGTILGFYFDEPAWNGVSEVDFRTVTKLLRTQYPTLRVMNCMTTCDIGVEKYKNFPETTPAFNEFCTDVMYDSYVNWNDYVRQGYLDKLKAKATNNQAIWGCVKGISKDPEDVGEMIKHLKGFYTEAIQEPRYAGIISFTFANSIEYWGFGLTTFFNKNGEFYNPELYNLYINIGRKVIDR